jgi:hypothetical protein
MLYVLYSGIGAKAICKHTIDDFLDIMNRNFVVNKMYGALHGDSHDPETLKSFNLREWLEWSGALLMQIKPKKR